MISENYNIHRLNTFHIDVSTKYYIEINALSDINDLVGSSQFTKEKLLIIGGGSNLLFRNNFDGIIANIKLLGIEVVKEDSDSVTLKVSAGETWHNFIEYTVENSYFGLENLALIPGKVGAAPVQNIGAYGIEQEIAFINLEGYNLETKSFQTLSKEECKFSYRNSIFKNELQDKFIITSVTYQLSKIPNFSLNYTEIIDEIEKDKLELNQKSIFDSIVKIRTRKLPNPELVGNCGSFFKNPIVSKLQLEKVLETNSDCKYFETDLENEFKISAGWLIESVGWKGKSYLTTDAAVSENHALVLINKGNAKGSDLFQLSEQIISDVKSKYEVELEREVNIV